MLTIVKGIGLLLLTLACFSVFSLKFPKGSEAMSGMANAAVASFLVEAEPYPAASGESLQLL